MMKIQLTKHKPSYIAVLLFSLVMSKVAVAAKSADDCQDKSNEEKEYSRCLDRVKDAVDRELQTWVNNHEFILKEFASKTGRKSALKIFNRSQNNFIKYREDTCRWQYLALSPGPKSGPAYKQCYIRLSSSRINELQTFTEIQD